MSAYIPYVAIAVLLIALAVTITVAIWLTKRVAEGIYEELQDREPSEIQLLRDDVKALRAELRRYKP